MTTIKICGGDMGSETMLVRCNLAEASAPVEANYQSELDSDYGPTQYQCADTRHSSAGLADIGRRLAARACEMPIDDFCCDWEEVD